MKNTSKDSDLAQSQAALRRAAERAREIAAQTRTPLVTFRDGQVRKEILGREQQDKGR